MQKEIKFIVNKDGLCLCGGSRRPQLAGVQGDDRICTIKYDLSAVYTENAKYFVEIVTGNNEPLQFAEDSEIVSLDTESETLAILVDNVITQDGGTCEINIVEEVLDSESYTASEGNTYTSYIYFEPKAKEIIKKKKTLYGIVAEILDKVKMFTQRVLRIEAKTEGFEARINKNENDILSHSRKLDIHTTTLESHATMLSEYGTQIGENLGSIANLNSEVKNINTDITILKTKADTKADKNQMFALPILSAHFVLGSIIEDLLTSDYYIEVLAQNCGPWCAKYAEESSGNTHTIEANAGAQIQPTVTVNESVYQLKEIYYEDATVLPQDEYYIIGIPLDLSREDDLLLATKVSAIALSNSASHSDYIANRLNLKQDKVNGKGLSTNDYTTAEKNKLKGVATGATKNIVDTMVSSTSKNALENKEIYNNLITLRNALALANIAIIGIGLNNDADIGSVADENTTAVTFANSVQTLANTLSGYKKINKIEIPKSIYEIGSNYFEDTAYYNNESNWGSNCELYIGDCFIAARRKIYDEAGDYTEYEPEEMRNVAIKNGTRLIANMAFAETSGVANVTIPKSVENLGRYTFQNSLVQSVTIADNTKATEIGEGFFSSCSAAEITIGSGITDIASFAFDNCSSIETLSLPDSIERIGMYAFNGCNIYNITALPANLKVIAEQGIDGIKLSGDIVLPSDLESIGSYAFGGEPTSFKLPKSLLYIDLEAFTGVNSTVTNIYLEDDFNTDLNIRALYNVGAECIVNMLAKLKDNSSNPHAHIVIINSNVMAELTDEQKQIATDKGWDLAEEMF